MGCWQLAVGCWLIIGYCPLAVGCQRANAIYYGLPATSCQLMTAIDWPCQFSHLLLAVGHWSLAIELLAIGCWLLLFLSLIGLTVPLGRQAPVHGPTALIHDYEDGAVGSLLQLPLPVWHLRCLFCFFAQSHQVIGHPPLAICHWLLDIGH